MRCSGNMCNRWPSVRGQERAGARAEKSPRTVHGRDGSWLRRWMHIGRSDAMDTDHAADRMCMRPGRRVTESFRVRYLVKRLA
jgi:hypothetical protein